MKAKITARLVAALRPADKQFEVHDQELRGFVLRVKPTGVMTYLVSYRLSNGRRSHVAIGRSNVISAPQARDKAREILVAVSQGIDPMSSRRLARANTLAGFLDAEYLPWAEQHLTTGRKTVLRLKYSFEQFLDRPLAEITSWNLEKWRNAKLKNGLKATSLNRDVASLKAAISKAVEWKVLEVHPIATLKMLPYDRSPKVRFLNDLETERLRNALDRREGELRNARDNHIQWLEDRNYTKVPRIMPWQFADHLKPMVLLAMNTGMRRGEIFSLSWEHVSLNGPEPILTVEGGNAKSGRTRHIPLNEEAVRVLKLWGEQHGNPVNGFVFPGANGAKLDNVKKSWAALLIRASINRFRWHDLRHDFASKLAMRGVDLNTIRELLGHSDFKMTLRYAHLAPRIMTEAVAKLNRPMNEEVGHAAERY